VLRGVVLSRCSEGCIEVMADNYWSALGKIFGETSCKAAFDCTPKIDQYGGYFAWFGITLYMIKALTTLTDEYLVPSLEVIADKLQVSDDVTGATFMAASSSAPELFTSLVATFFMVNSVGLGTITGSAVFNILVIVGATGLIACKDRPMKIWWYPLIRDSFFCILSIGELLLVLLDDRVYWWEGLIMFLTYLFYCVYMMKINTRIINRFGLVNPRELEDAESESLHQVVVVGASEDGAPGAEESSRPNSADGLSRDDPGLRTAGQGMGGTLTPQASPSRPGGLSPQVTPGLMDKPRPPSTDPPGSRASRSSSRQSMRGSISEGGRRRPRWSMSELIFINKEDEEAERPVVNAAWPFAPSARAIPHRRPVEEDERAASKGSSHHSEDGTDEIPPDTKDPRLLGQELQTLSLEPPEASFCGFRCRDPLTVFWEKTMPTPRWYLILFILAIIYIPPCTYMMVDATNRIGLIFRIPSLAMGLIFLAAATSIPDMIGSIAVAKQGEGDMAIANALGSNVFNILFGLGFPWMIQDARGEKVEFPGAFDDLTVDFIILGVALLIFVLALACNRWYLTWRTGIVLLFLYGSYVIFNLVMVGLEAKGDPDK